MKSFKDANPHAVKWSSVFLIAIALLIAAILFFGCNTEKKIIKEDNAAIERSTSKLSNLKRVAEIVRERFPCITDTVTNIVHDTTTNTLVKTVSHIDTILKAGEKYIVFRDTTYYEKGTTIFRDRIVTDKELTNRQKDTINSLRLQLAAQNGLIQEVRTNLSQARKTANKWEWFFYGSLLLLVLSHVIRSYVGGWFGSITKIFKKS